MKIVYEHRPAHLYAAVVLRALLLPSSGRLRDVEAEELYVTHAELEAFAAPRARLKYMRARYRRLRVRVLRRAVEHEQSARQ